MNISPIHCPDSGCFWSAHGIPDQYTQARAWHLAAHRVEEHGETLTAEQIAYATRAGHVIPGAARTTAAAVAAEGALPVPVGDQPQPLDDQQAPEPIPARWDRTVILPEHPNGDLDGQTIVCCIADDGTKRPIGLFLDAEHREALGLVLVDPNGEDEQHTALLAEVQRLKAELATAREDSAFLERNTLPELRREIEHHKDGKQRWRDRAEKAEARVAELRAERHTTNEALSDAAEQLRANRDRITELEKAVTTARGKALHEAASWFDERADAEPDQAYRARVMRGAANDIRRLAADATTDRAEEAS